MHLKHLLTIIYGRTHMKMQLISLINIHIECRFWRKSQGHSKCGRSWSDVVNCLRPCVSVCVCGCHYNFDL